MVNKPDKDELRLLKLLSKHKKTGLPLEQDTNSYQISNSSRSFSFSQQIVKSLKKKEHVDISADRIIITQLGMVALKHALEPDLGARDLHRDCQAKTIEMDCGKQTVLENLNESPLARLYGRKTNTGESYINRAEFEAGERFRKDFERGQLQPKISASLHSSVGSSGRGVNQGICDISDFALDARNRIRKAVEALGPELSGVTLDICCFLKGLELVERERKWPPRSAKLMLKTGLSILARHYGLLGNYDSRTSGITTWTAKDYRPVIS